MNISPGLEETAIKEFEFTFGDTIREFNEDAVLYDFFVREFMNGVVSGMANKSNAPSQEKSAKEIKKLKSHSGAKVKHEDPKIVGKILTCANYVYSYGNSWGNSVVSKIELGPSNRKASY